MTGKKIRILILEDSQSDAKLLLRELKRGGYEVEHQIVQTAGDLENALDNYEWDVVLSDFSMPGFEAPEALAIVREQRQLDIPFIIISGTVGEETAVKAMKAGATDFFTKGKLTRLIPAVEREVREAAHRRARREAEAELRKAEERFAKSFNSSPAAIIILRLSDGVAIAANPRFVELTGIEKSAVIGQSMREDSFWVDDAHRQALLEQLRQTGTLRSEEVIVRHVSGKEITALLSAELIELDGEQCILAFFQDITDLRRAQDEVLESKNLLEKTFSSLTEAVMVIDSATRTIQLCNPAMEEIFGYTPEELIGKSTEILHVNREMYEHFAAIGDPVLTSENVFRNEYQMRHKDGHIIDTENTVTTLEEEKGFMAGVVSVVRDISARKEDERKLKRYVQRLQILHEIDRGILTATEPETIAQRTLIELKRVIPFTGAIVLTYDANLEQVTVLAIESEIESPWEVGHTIATENFTLWEQLKADQPYIVQDVNEVSEFGSTIEAQLAVSGIQSYVCVPLQSRNSVLGLIGFASDKPHAFASDTIEIAQEVAAQVAIALTSASLRKMEQHRIAELEALSQASLQLTSRLDQQAVIDTILDYAIILIEADDAHIFLYDGNDLTFGTAYWDGQKQSEPFSKPRTDGFTYTVAQSGERLILTDMTAHPLTSGQSWKGSIIGLPLTVAGETLGVMSLAFQSTHQFTDSEVQVLELLADQAAIAIHNAQLYQKIQEHAEQLEQRVAERTAELQHQKERIETILYNSSDGVVILESDGRIVQANRAFCNLAGFDEVTLVEGQYMSTVTRLEPTDRLQDGLHRVIEVGTPQRIELTVYNADDEIREMAVLLSPVENNGDAAHEIVCSMYDITTRKQIEAELRQALEKEKELNKLKTDFTSLVSHEFRTPLAVIMSGAETMLRYFDRLSPEYLQKKLNLIKKQVKHLDHLIDDVLLVTKTEQVGLKFEPERLDAVALCEEIIDVFTLSEALPVNVKFIHEGPCDKQNIDPNLFRHILQNLVSNAIKYSPQGGEVCVSLTCTNTQTVVVVSDEGIGIPEKDQKQLFSPFHRAGNVGSLQGTGFGLVIVKRSVERHGGKIEFTSKEGEGTTFTVTLSTKFE